MSRQFVHNFRTCLVRVSLYSVTITLLCMVLSIYASPGLAASPRMRPYVGIGLITFSAMDGAQNRNLQLPLYEEPGLSRIGVLISSALSGNEWIFGPSEGGLPLIVSARKGDWLRIFFDDAGREAWINSRNEGHFQSWEQYLKLHAGRMLPALQPQYYQLLQQPGGKQLSVLTPKQVFKVLRVENAWCMVLVGSAQIGWLRWHDDDSRLLFGFSH